MLALVRASSSKGVVPHYVVAALRLALEFAESGKPLWKDAGPQLRQSFAVLRLGWNPQDASTCSYQAGLDLCGEWSFPDNIYEASVTVPHDVLLRDVRETERKWACPTASKHYFGGGAKPSVNNASSCKMLRRMSQVEHGRRLAEVLAAVAVGVRWPTS
eukprot:277962-Pyramimonas_sp.AAC.1